MSGNQPVDSGRRRFIAGATAAGGALGVCVSPAVAGSRHGEEWLVPGQDLVVLYDGRLAVDQAALDRFGSSGTLCLPLGDDPVRLWRGEAGALLRARGTRLMGMTRWADLLIVRGLAAESGRRLRFERLDRTTGVLTWLIA